MLVVFSLHLTLDNLISTAKYSYQILKISSSSSGYMYHLQIQKIQNYCNTKQQVPNRKKGENDLLLLTWRYNVALQQWKILTSIDQRLWSIASSILHDLMAYTLFQIVICICLFSLGKYYKVH